MPSTCGKPYDGPHALIADHLDPGRFLADLHALRAVGAKGTGCVRPAFSAADVEARLWLAARMRAAGLEPVFDPMGNLFGLAPGDDPSFLLGSHSDTQIEGGWLDGAFGVIAALEVTRAAVEAGANPVSVVSFQDEEGRFGGLTGSSVWTGALPLEEADRLQGPDGETLGEARDRAAAIVGPAFVAHDRFTAFIEPHIEQGPVLDRAGEAVAVVEAIVGYRNATVVLEGEQNHAGTTPMPLRRDAFQTLVAWLASVNERFEAMASPATVWTTGRISVQPGAVSIVPGRAEASLQIRDGNDALLDAMAGEARDILAKLCAERGIADRWIEGPSASAVRLDAGLVSLLQAAARATRPDGRWRTMASGALHDASNVSRLMPTAMLFVPSIGGISHAFAEDTAEDDLVAGLAMLGAAADGFRRGTSV